MINLSIVVCTYNRSKLLKNCLEELVTQVRDDLELIVVDNNSSDDTAEVVKTFGTSIQYILEKNVGLSHARNTGYKKAQGQFIAYIDDDAIISKGYVDLLISLIQTTKADVYGGPIHPWYDVGCTKPKWWDDTFEIRSWGDNVKFLSTFEKKRGFSGSNIIINRELLISQKGFRTDLGMSGNKVALGEDSEFCYRISDMIFFYDPNLLVYHYANEKNFNLKYIFYRRFKTGISTSVITGLKKNTILRIPFIVMLIFLMPFTIVLNKKKATVKLLSKISYNTGIIYQQFLGILTRKETKNEYIS